MRPYSFSLGPTFICSTIAVVLLACHCGGGTLSDENRPCPCGQGDLACVSRSDSRETVADFLHRCGEPPTDAGPLFARTGGTFAAFPLDAVDGTAFMTPARDTSAGAKSELRVLVADRPSLCTTGPLRGNETIFSIDALSADTTFRPGTFTQLQNAGPGHVDVSITKLNATCDSDNQDYGAATATVTFTTVNLTAVAGTFEVTLMGNAGTLKGTFNVPLCGEEIVGTCQP